MRKGTISVLTWFCMAVCSSIGPGTVPRDRVDYVNVIGTSWERETLLNIVKLRYGHAPSFFSDPICNRLPVPRHRHRRLGGFQLHPVSNNLGLAGTATAKGQYTDRPTVIYTPLTGVDFLQKLMTPIPPSAVLFVLQAGYDAETLMPVMLDSINGINNQAKRGMRGAADPRFNRVAQLVRDLQLDENFGTFVTCTLVV